MLHEVKSVAAPLSLAEPDEVGLAADRLQRLTDLLQSEIDRKRLPGAVALIARDGKPAYFQSLGVRNPESDAPMRPDTILHSA